jgi:hypothetical protein
MIGDDTVEDEQIVALYWARSERAIRESMSKYGAYCQAIACNILSFRSDAEEAVNDTWLGAWNAMPPAQPAIFLHCATGATGGCVGLPEQEMRRVLTWLDPELHPYILISGRA